MDLNRAADALDSLINDGPHDLAKLAKVSTLLDAFDRENLDVDGKIAWAYADEKIGSVRTFFEILCGVGEEGWDNQERKVKENLSSYIYSLRGIISDDGFGISSL